MSKYLVTGGGKFQGEISLPGDKSLAHRCLIFAALARGKSEFENLPGSRDVMSTVSVLRMCGVKVELSSNGAVMVESEGILSEPADVLDCGNSGTTARLMCGVLSGFDKTFSVLTGDSSLRRRPMRRVVSPLREMGAHILGREDGLYLPLAIKGSPLRGVSHSLKVASAQVKTSLILAGLRANGVTQVEEPFQSRDHTERLLPHFGASLRKEGLRISLEGPQELTPYSWRIPGDISSAAFFIAGAVCAPGSHIVIRDVLLNPTRTGFLKKLQEMGAHITVKQKSETPEPVGDVEVKFSSLRGAVVSPQEVPLLIDEIPLLAVVATQAVGTTVITGASELRVKESDRINTTVEMLRALNAKVEELEDGLKVEGPVELTGADVTSHGDHRIAMAGVIAGTIARGETVIDGFEAVDVSFPEFAEIFEAVYEPGK